LGHGHAVVWVYGELCRGRTWMPPIPKSFCCGSLHDGDGTAPLVLSPALPALFPEVNQFWSGDTGMKGFRSQTHGVCPYYLNTDELFACAGCLRKWTAGRPSAGRDLQLRRCRESPGTCRLLAYSMADQALAVGGGFLVNIVLARTQPKKNMACSRFPTRCLHSSWVCTYAAILEPCTVYGSGRYRHLFSEYLRLISPLQRGLSVVFG